jgi:hypothetical protein
MDIDTTIESTATNTNKDNDTLHRVVLTTNDDIPIHSHSNDHGINTINDQQVELQEQQQNGSRT